MSEDVLWDEAAKKINYLDSCENGGDRVSLMCRILREEREGLAAEVADLKKQLAQERERRVRAEKVTTRLADAAIDFEKSQVRVAELEAMFGKEHYRYKGGEDSLHLHKELNPKCHICLLLDSSDGSPLLKELDGLRRIKVAAKAIRTEFPNEHWKWSHYQALLDIALAASEKP